LLGGGVRGCRSVCIGGNQILGGCFDVFSSFLDGVRGVFFVPVCCVVHEVLLRVLCFVCCSSISLGYWIVALFKLYLLFLPGHHGDL
jgi:hypothetical protein